MIKTLSEHWFLTEPAFFALLCLQQIEENPHIECVVRCGQGKIEYNPLLLKKKTFKEFEDLMRIEMIRLFLKHPYEREPEGCSREAMAIGSNVTIADGYCLLHKDKLPLKEPGFYHLPLGQYYEWYAKKIQEQLDEQEQKDTPKDNQSNDCPETQNLKNKQNSQSKEENQDDNDSNKKSNQSLSGLWREDSLQRQKINELIERTSDWGNIPAEIVESIKASTKARINNRMIWQGFKSTILNSQRKLTRMRPNRRTGFLEMGNKREFTTRILIAIDVSGSITDEALSDFFSAINRLFHYGIAEIDTCQFDAKLGPIEPMHNASHKIEVCGRGGTNYQPIIEYIENHHEYDGLIILTDGQAPTPSFSKKTNKTKQILWVCQDRDSYESSHLWMEKCGRCCHL